MATQNRAAWITGTCTLAAAVIGGLFLLFSKSSPQNQQTATIGNSNNDSSIMQVNGASNVLMQNKQVNNGVNNGVQNNGVMDHPTFVMTNGALAKDDLNELQRRYPYGFVLFRSDGTKTEVLQTFGGVKFILHWDSVRIKRESVAKLKVSLPVILVVDANASEKDTPSPTVQQFTVDNKKGSTENIGCFAQQTLEVTNGAVSTPQQSLNEMRCLVFEVLDDNPLHPLYLLGQADFEVKFGQNGLPQFEN